MNTRQRITLAIERFNQHADGQANLSSEAARSDLTDLIYDAIMKQQDFDTESSTHNEQQMYLFTNKEHSEHK